ncbi:MAG: ATP-binding protein [Clostridia bacterium]
MDLFDFAKSGYSLKENVLEGFRLQKLEVYNWGTFDSNVWRFNLNGETTLLTGDVGSGKSTLVDALSTLLLAPRKVNYNKAADSTSKERTTATYVRGFYGHQNGKSVALRDFDKYSVLLATFKDEFNDECLTLAQFFYFKEKNSSPIKFYIVAEKELFIAKEFSLFKNAGDLKRKLKSENINVYDSYSDYRERFCKILGGLTEQALDLFGQTISMKKVDELTRFVRENMIVKEDVDENITNLLNHYSNLNSAHETVLTAKNQIEMLEPISKKGEVYLGLKEKMYKLEIARENLAVWIAKKKEPLLKEEITKLKFDIDVLSLKIEQEKKKIENTDDNMNSVRAEQYKNGGSALESFKRELKSKNEELQRCIINLEKYSVEAKNLKLEIPKSVNSFKENFDKIPEIESENRIVLENEEKNKTEFLIKINSISAEKNDIEQEVKSLEKRKSNIQADLIALREKIAKELGIEEQDLPFTGELIEVLESETKWEGAIERLLNSFARSMLVSEKNYKKVSDWVNKNSLGIKLVYHKTSDAKSRISNINPLSVFAKITVKQDSIFKNWVENWIFEKFDYLCLDNMDSFRTANKAISPEGQIKSITRHEKDDRRKIGDRRNYVLGFSNNKKILAFKEQIKKLSGEISDLNKKFEQCKNKINLANSVLASADKIKDFTDFSVIDVGIVRAEITKYKKQIKEIETANDIFLKLAEQLQQLTLQKEKQTENKDRFIANKSKLEVILDETERKAVENEENLKSSEDKDFSYFIEILKDENLTLKNCETYERKINENLNKEIRTSLDECNKLEKSIEKLMHEFKFKHQSKSLELEVNISSLNEYVSNYEKLMFDDLPRYENDFKNMLHSNILRQISVFRSKLDNAYNKVKTRINDINKSLNSIDFNKGRYIKIEYSDISDSEIKKFREELRNCTSDIVNDIALEIKFTNIKKIIERFKGREGYVEIDKKWTKKVTDVRMWFEFGASERLRETDAEYEYYADSNGKSGGQKEKLAYTILAASLVYNYKLDGKSDDNRSFRFVAIDEAFSRGSEESTKYGLELFQKLKFQLLVITPLVKINAIEPFVSNVGFVNHDDIKHISSLQNIPIEEYKKRKELAKNG